jgi:hypothetical protein
MTLPLELWHAVTLMVAFLGFVFAAGKVLLKQVEKHIDTRFSSQSARLDQVEAYIDNRFNGQSKRLDQIEDSQKLEANRWIDVERQLLILKADLPLNYVRREDYVQAVATIMAKLDAMSMRFENILLRGQKNHE